MPDFLIVARKEIVDSWRDARSVISSAFYCLMGPAVVLLVSFAHPAGSAGSGPNVLLSMISVFALVAAFVGGMNVAMDTVAGERERRSLLPLFVNPIPRGDVLAGKWLAVSIFGLGGLLLNLAGFAYVLASSNSAIPPVGGLLFWAGFGLIPLTLFAAAVELLVSTLCRSTKEAHTYLSFLVFVPTVLGMFLVFFPHVPALLELLPVVGQQLLFDLSTKGHGGLLPHAAALAATTISGAGLALLATRNLVERDEILYSR